MLLLQQTMVHVSTLVLLLLTLRTDAGLGTWTQFANDDIDWSLGSSTPSSGTGPQAGDVTGGDFLYTESSLNYGTVAGLSGEF